MSAASWPFRRVTPTRARTSTGCATRPQHEAFPTSRWACRATTKSPSNAAPHSCVWAPRFSVPASRRRGTTRRRRRGPTRRPIMSAARAAGDTRVRFRRRLMSVFRKAAVYLGLVDDEDDEVYEYEDAIADDGAGERPAARPRNGGEAGPGVVRPIREPQLAHPHPSPPLRVAAGG